MRENEHELSEQLALEKTGIVAEAAQANRDEAASASDAMADTVAEDAARTQHRADDAASRVAASALQVAALLAEATVAGDQARAAVTASQLAELVTAEAATAARHTALAASMVAQAAVTAAAVTAASVTEAVRLVDRETAKVAGDRARAGGASDETLWVITERARIEHMADVDVVAEVMAKTVARSASSVQVSANASAAAVAAAASDAAAMVASSVTVGDEAGAALAASRLAAQVSSVAAETARETAHAAVRVAKSAAAAAVEAATAAAEAARLIESHEIGVDGLPATHGAADPLVTLAATAAESARIARSAEVATEVCAMAIRVERTATAIQLQTDAAAVRVADAASRAAAVVAALVPEGEEAAAVQAALEVAATVSGTAMITAQEAVQAAVLVAWEATQAATDTASAAADTARMIQRAVVSAAAATQDASSEVRSRPPAADDEDQIVQPSGGHRSVPEHTRAEPTSDLAAGAAQIRVFVLDEQELVRRGLIDLLDATDDVIVVGEASTAADALHRIPAAHPDVAIVDGHLPGGAATRLCHDLRSSHPEIFTLILATDENDDALFSAVTAGAAGYLLKKISGPSLIDSIRQIAAGRSMMDPALTGRLLERVRQPNLPDPRISNLTTRDLQILELVAEGLSNKQIAQRLQLADATVKNYVSAVLTKLHLGSRTQAALLGATLVKRT